MKSPDRYTALGIVLFVASVLLAGYLNSGLLLIVFCGLSIVSVGFLRSVNRNQDDGESYRDEIGKYIEGIELRMWSHIDRTKKYDGSKSGINFMSSVDSSLKRVLSLARVLNKPPNLSVNDIKKIIDKVWYEIEAGVIREPGSYQGRLKDLEKIENEYCDLLMSLNTNHEEILKLQAAACEICDKILRSNDHQSNQMLHAVTVKSIKRTTDKEGLNFRIKWYAEKVGYTGEAEIP